MSTVFLVVSSNDVIRRLEIGNLQTESRSCSKDVEHETCQIQETDLPSHLYFKVSGRVSAPFRTVFLECLTWTWTRLNAGTNLLTSGGIFFSMDARAGGVVTVQTQQRRIRFCNCREHSHCLCILQLGVHIP